MYHLEKVPAASFKMMIAYIDSMQGESRARVIQEAQEYLNKKSDIP